jgi:hypothetical protein
MRKAMAAAALSATLVSGTAIGATIFAPNIVGAQSDPSTTTTTPTPTPAAPDGQTREDHLRTTLQPLVDNGTITEAQRDAVIAALAAEGPGDHGGRHFGGRFGFGASEAVASVLGLDASTLRSELASGKTLADIAGEKGVDVQKVIDAIVTEQTARLDEAVTAGKLTQAEADARKADLTQRATDLVNGVRPEPPAGFDGRGPWGRGPGGPGTGSGTGSSSSGSSQPAATTA